MLGKNLETLREKSALVHNITNYVTVNDVANSLLAIGASPIMSDDIEEVEEITSICSALNINIGTLNQRTIKSMMAAGKKAVELGHPAVLDPVGAGASALRTNTAKNLIDNIHFTVIRGNMSEIKAVVSGFGTTKGVDADAADAVTEENLDAAVKFVKDTARAFDCIIAVTGAIDLIADSEKCYVVRNGRAEMSRITGTGCQLSGIIAAFVSANPDDRLSATAAAVASMGVAGEIGWNSMPSSGGNCSYRGAIMDALYNLTGAQLDELAKVEIR